jgi:hypothetical protein
MIRFKEAKNRRAGNPKSNMERNREAGLIGVDCVELAIRQVVFGIAWQLCLFFL